MKIRNGFVSNSSSSSFIIGTTDISKIAKSMFNTVIRDLMDCEGNTSKKHKDTFKTLRKTFEEALKRDDIQKGEVGVVFTSCNYDTYIVKHQDKVYVSTCRNHIWDIDDEAPILYQGGGVDDGEDDKTYTVMTKYKYFQANKGEICDFDEGDEI